MNKYTNLQKAINNLSFVQIQLELLDYNFDYWIKRYKEILEDIKVEKILELCRTGK